MKAFSRADRRITALGKSVLGVLDQCVLFIRFSTEMFLNLRTVFRNFHLALEQMYVIGITSLPLVALTSIFTGAVAAWQAAYSFAD